MRSADDEFAFTPELRTRLASNLAAFRSQRLEDESTLRAAVGVVLLPDDANRACFVLTRRLMALRRHRGQWALPGGRLELGESPQQAALREIAEEIDLHLPRASILGILDDFPTRSGHLITPYVLWSSSPDGLRANPEEVDAAFKIPLEDLDRADNFSLEPLLHFRNLAGSSVHAPTAAILYQFREVALHAREVRVADVEQPFFAWS